MKNQAKFIPTFALLSALLGACISEPTEDMQTMQSPSPNIEGETMQFRDFESYESAINNPGTVQKQNFTSLASLVTDEVGLRRNFRILNNELEDALKEFEGAAILEILDQDGMVIIDDKLFYLDFVNKTVAVTEELELKDSIKDGNLESDNIQIFSFEDDVIGYYENSGTTAKIKNENNQRQLATCPVDWGPLVPNSSSDCSWNVCTWYSDYTENGYLYRGDAKVAYQSAGIYFRLKTEIKHMRRLIGSTALFGDTSADLAFHYIGYFKSKKNSSPQRNINECMAENNHRLQKVHYESSRGLDYFELGVTFNVHLGGNHAISGYPDAFELRKIKKS